MLATSRRSRYKRPITVSVLTVDGVEQPPQLFVREVAVSSTLSMSLRVATDADTTGQLGRMITWVSSDTGVATVDRARAPASDTVIVTGIGTGSCTITATPDGPSNISPIVLTITVPVSGVTALDTVTVGTETDTTIPLTWVGVSDGAGGEALYQVRWKKDAGTGWWDTADGVAVDIVGTGVSSTASYTITGLLPGSSYEVQVEPYRGVDLDNAEAFGTKSAETAATTTGTPVATTLRITTQPPVQVTTGGTFVLSVEVLDAAGQPMADNARSITISKSAGVGTLSGTLVKSTNSNGQVSFTDLSLDTIGTGITLDADASGLTGVTSNAIEAIAASTGHPNEPAGYTRFAENDFDTRPVAQIAGTTGDEIDGKIWRFGGGGWSIETDATAPESPSNVLRIRFPTGQPSGTGPGWYQHWDQSGESSNTAYSKFYTSFRLKLVGSDWENHHVGCKWTGYWGVGRNNSGRTPTNFFSLVDGTGNESDRIRSDFSFAVLQQDIVSRRLSPNRNGPWRIQVGTWYHWEMNCELGTINVADGILQVWLNGVLALDYSNVLWHNTANPSGFWGRRNNPVWGGQGTIPKTRADDIHIDHEYMSGVAV